MNSREKIHEFVNMARHPEAKNLAEALEMESKFSNCIFKFKDFYFTEANRDEINAFRIGFYTGAKEQLELDEEVLEDMEDIYLLHHNVELSGVAMDNIGKPTILGRPITAFDVCWALNKKQPEHYYFATDNGIWAGYELKDKCEGIIALMVEFKTKKPDGTDIFSTEWSDDTSDKITKLINL